MTCDHSLASKSSTQRTQKSDLMCRGQPQQQQQQQQHQQRPGHKDSGSVRSMPLCGASLFQKRQQQQQQQQDSTINVEQQHHNHQHCHQSDSKKTFSGLEESSGGTANYPCYNEQQQQQQQQQQHQSTTSPSGTGNELSSDDQPMDSRDSEAFVSAKNRVPPSIVLKKQMIYYQGKFKPVFVQVWPDAHRIPLHERHRLQDPMRQHYGKLSRRARLVKEFEHYDKPRSEGQPIPLLPKRMRDEAKVRLMAWYRPLDINCGHSSVTSLPGSESSRRSSQAVSSR